MNARFEEEQAIGQGAMGQVHKALDPRLRRTVAVKTLLLDDESSKARFIREAQVTGSLEHPALPPVYELGQHEDGTSCFALKLLEGETLEAVCHRLCDGDVPAVCPHTTVKKGLTKLAHIIDNHGLWLGPILLVWLAYPLKDILGLLIDLISRAMARNDLTLRRERMYDFYIMSSHRTQLIFPAELWSQVQERARAEGRSAAALVREATRQYLTQQPQTVDWSEDPLHGIVGLFDSGLGDLAEEHDQYLYDQP